MVQSYNKTIENFKGKVLEVNVYLLFKVMFEYNAHLSLPSSPFCFTQHKTKQKH